MQTVIRDDVVVATIKCQGAGRVTSFATTGKNNQVNL